MTKRLGFLGPAGTYCEEAAIGYDSAASLVPLRSIPAVIAAVDAQEVDEGVVPIENSLEGAVTFSLDLLIHDSNMFICSEVLVPVQHRLIGKAGTKLEDIRVVYSHPQGLAQCRGYLEKHLPHAQQSASLSTAGSVTDMHQSDVVAAAIANERAAGLFDGTILVSDIQDDPNNVTRFVVLGPKDHAPTGVDKTSICFDFEHDAPGILYEVLGELSKRGINLAKIESRPTRRSLGRYIFLIDVDGHREDPAVKEALAAVKAQVSMFKIFGSYPRQISSDI